MIARAAFEGFAGPVDVLSGDDDAFSPLPELRALLAGLPRVRLSVIAGADHFFASAGLDTLAELARRSAGSMPDS
jgi:pimeloyl-ACP methyl ester carboxylesterase